MRSWRSLAAIAASLGLAWTSVADALDEATLKAAFLWNFAEFVTWPDESGGSLRLCVVGHGGFGAALDELDGQRIRDMHLEVRRAVPQKDLPRCQLVFLPQGQAADLNHVLASIRGRPVLLVTEAEGLAPLGAGISLVARPDGRLGFDINLEAIRASGLKPSSRLLTLARRVY